MTEEKVRSAQRVVETLSAYGVRYVFGVPGAKIDAVFDALDEMVADGRSGSVVTLLADSGDRYTDTYFSDEWVSAQGLDPTAPAEALVEFERNCHWTV